MKNNVLGTVGGSLLLVVGLSPISWGFIEECGKVPARLDLPLFCPPFLVGVLLLSQLFPLPSLPLGTGSWKGTAEGKQINVESGPRGHQPRQQCQQAVSV